MIPKVIHYCWFGEGKMSELSLRCIESWKKNLSEYRIKVWNEKNFDITSNSYVFEAYQRQKYAFVTDYVRLYALYHEGGIYMDTDVEVIKPLDIFLTHEAFSGYQTPEEIPTGLIGAKPKNKWIEANLRVYDNKKFVKADGSIDLSANVASITSISKEQGFEEGGSYQVFGDGVAIYPVDYFCAKDYRTGKYIITENTYAIHHFAGSWLPLSTKLKLNARRILGDNIYLSIKQFLKR